MDRRTDLLLHHLHLHEPSRSRSSPSLACLSACLCGVHVESEVVAPALALAVDGRPGRGVVGVGVRAVGVGSRRRRLRQDRLCTNQREQRRRPGWRVVSSELKDAARKAGEQGRARAGIERRYARAPAGGAYAAEDDVVYINCSVRSLDAFMFCGRNRRDASRGQLGRSLSLLRARTTTSPLRRRRTCVLISRTSLNPIPMFASFDWRSMTTFELCSSTCLLDPAFLDGWFADDDLVRCCSEAI